MGFYLNKVNLYKMACISTSNLLRHMMVANARQLHHTTQLQAATLKMKRHWQVPLPRLGESAKLKPRHSIYRVDRCENGPKTLTVILSQDSMEYGVHSEVVTLPKYFGRKLIYEKQAVYASPANLKALSTSEKGSEQTVTGKRLLLWLRTQDTLHCPYRGD